MPLGHLKLYNRNGREVPRGAVNFGAYNARNFPFAIKQPPSSRNALGLVKFMFPNKYNIYLHDTPQKALFDREKRDFSHGCIRLQQPFDFAYEILSSQEADPKGYFHSVLNTGRETYVQLDQHVPVHIIYRTAFTQAQGRVQYRDDVYARDAVDLGGAAQGGGFADGGSGLNTSSTREVVHGLRMDQVATREARRLSSRGAARDPGRAWAACGWVNRHARPVYRHSIRGARGRIGGSRGLRAAATVKACARFREIV